jgi:ArsR family transcriptional regulator
MEAYRMITPVNVFKALADETRLKIVILLLNREMCVCELEKILKTTQTKISRHLSILKFTGLVKFRRAGQWVYYSLVDRNDPFYNNLTQTLKTIESDYFDNIQSTLGASEKC